MPDCPIDGRQVADATLCPACVRNLLDDLRALADLAEQLEITLTRQGRAGERNGARSSDRPLPFDSRASAELGKMHAVLAEWVSVVARWRRVGFDRPDTVAEYVSWLALWPSTIAVLPDADLMYREVESLGREAHRIVDLPPQRRYVGPCEDCRADLYVGMRAVIVTCRTPGCGARYPITERRAWLLEQVVDQLRTARQLATELPWITGMTVSPALVGMWAHRGKLTRYGPHPRDPRAAERYRVGEIIECARVQALAAASSKQHRPAC